MPQPHRRSADFLWCAAVLVLVAAAARVHFWIWTRWTIEDALIIGRMVRNLTEHGEFTFSVGQRASASTSPLFAMLAAAVSSTGIDPLVSAKLLGVVASTATCLVIFDLLAEHYPPRAALAGIMVYAMLPPSVAYAVGGMETPVYTLACALALERMMRNRPRQAVIWAAVATLLRPDGVIVFMVVAALAAWRHRTDGWELVRTFWPAAAIMTAGWGAHALYFGTVMPQSLIAKGVGYHVDALDNTIRYLRKMLLAQPAGVTVYVLAVFGAWRICRRARVLWLPVIWYVAYHVPFFVRAPMFDWYLQPPLWVLGLFAGFGIVEALTLVRALRPNWVTHDTASLGATVFIAVTLGAATLLFGRGRIESQEYEETVRAGAGRWLASHTAPTAIVFTESLGYIGYQTDNPFVDWPGLASPGVPELINSTHTTQSRRAAYDAIIGAYRPSYLVLRDSEWNVLAAALRNEYTICATFSPSQASQRPYVVAGHQCQ